MKRVIETLFNIIGDEKYHTKKNVSVEAFNSRVQFEEYINDRKDIERDIIDDIMVFKHVKKRKKKSVEYFYGFTTLNGENLRCCSIISKNGKSPKIHTDYGHGITIENDKGNTVIYVHRNEKGCTMVDLRDFQLNGRNISKIMHMKNEDGYAEGYIISVKEKGNNIYYTAHLEENKVLIIDNVNDNIREFEKGEIIEYYPLTFDLFKYTRKEDGKTFIYSNAYRTIMNEFPKEYILIRVFVGHPKNYMDEGIVVLYKPTLAENSNLVTNGDIYLTPLKGIRTVLGNSSDNMVKMDSELTRIFKPIHGINGFYSLIVEDGGEEPLVKYIFFLPRNGKLEPIEVYGSSAPTEIFVCKETCTITLVYQLQGFYQVVSYWENDMQLYRNSYVEIKPNEDVDIDIQLSKYKEHLDSLTIDKEMSDDEYFNLFYFFNMSKGLSNSGEEALISTQYSNLTTREIDRDIKRLYMSNNGKMLIFKYTDNTLVEYISESHNDMDEKIKIYDTLDKELMDEVERLQIKRIED